MAQNPKYDNDMVNLGYLNKRLGQTEESINKNNSSISQLPKNYSTPPNPPYYKDSLLCYGNKIYRCNKTKMNGTFSWNDWTIVATDDTTISDFINNTYEVEKLEIQEQIDGKIQTHYQENDPSKDWTTDLEKGRHVGDYWYNTSDNTQWRYNQITTGPTITYGWGQVNIPKSVFDTIDRKKSIYTEKPTSYKKDDLWIIEETLSDDDLPIGTDENPIAKGDWVFSIADSEVYNKEHWVKRDEDVSLSYLEQHYYTITEIDSNLEVIERNTESKITKATEEISLNVSQTYTTKEEHTKAINDFDKQIGTINNTIIKHKETLSDLSVEVGEVSASVESVETKTEELTVDLNGVKKNIIPMSASANSSIYIEDASDNPLIQLEIEGKSIQDGTPTPDAPVEIESVGYENLFDGIFRQGNSKDLDVVDRLFNENNFKLKANQSYTISTNLDTSIFRYAINLNINEFPIVSTQNFYDSGWETVNTFTFTPTQDCYLGVVVSRIDNANIIPSDISSYWFQIEKGSIAHSYISYDKYGIEFNITNKIDTRTLLIVLNEPLRSLPNGVKDIAYVNHGKLYIDRRVGDVEITRSMIYSTFNPLTYSKEIRVLKTSINNIAANKHISGLMCNTFVFRNAGSWGYDEVGIFANAGNSNECIAFRIPVDADATYFDEHPTYINYELAEPYTEEIGEIKMPNTFEGINYITITDELKPTINLTYATNTLITNYVEKHVAELKVSDEEIRSYVSSVDSFATTLGSTIDGKLQDISKTFNSYVPTSDFVTLEKSVNQLQTDTYTKTEINTKLTDGSVTKVSTVSGTFDENGMHYEKTNAPTSSTINERGVEVDSTTTGEELLFAGYDEELNQTIVRTENLTVRKYFIVGDNSRIENYGNGGGIFII